jgi:hypothetical protein
MLSSSDARRNNLATIRLALNASQGARSQASPGTSRARCLAAYPGIKKATAWPKSTSAVNPNHENHQCFIDFSGR